MTKLQQGEESDAAQQLGERHRDELEQSALIDVLLAEFYRYR